MPMMLLHDCNNVLTFKWSPMHRASIWRSAPFLFVLDCTFAWGKNMVNRNLTSGVDMWRLCCKHFWRNPLTETAARSKWVSIWEASSGNTFHSAQRIQAKKKKCPARFYWGRLWRPACFAGLRKISLGFATSDSRKMKSARLCLPIQITNERRAPTNSPTIPSVTPQESKA